mmetsp:Transcript_2680/g.3652  ORF Transcript_2680/g.3652 Transcript_2680/m.3652 type:complete len:626 (+) Transcript_2680:3-1880(+)
MMPKKKLDTFFESVPPGKIIQAPRIMSKEEAMKIELISNIETSLKTNNSICLESVVTSNAPKSFRWVFRYTDDDMAMPIIDGDVGSVFPGITNEELRKNCHVTAQFFDDAMMIELANFMQDTLKGLPTRKSAFTWHSKPPYEFSVNIHFHSSYRYFDQDINKIVCIQIGETHDVTATLREHEALVAQAIARHRESTTRHRDSIDHRFGNKLRLMHLLASRLLAPILESNTSTDKEKHNKSDAAKLLQCFENLSHEVAIRRGHFESLPKIEPVRCRDFIEAEFITLEISFIFDEKLQFVPHADRKNPRLLFFDKCEEPLSPLVLQVLFWQDLASNSFKHGNGQVEILIGPNFIQISNPIKNHSHQISVPQKKINTASSSQSDQPKKNCPNTDTWRRNKVGLRTLRDVAERIHLELTFDDSSRPGFFISTLYFSSIQIQPEIASPSSSPREIQDPTITEKENSIDFVQKHGTRFAWVLLEDESLICQLFTNIMKKRFNIDIDIIQFPADVGNFVRHVYDLHRRKKKSISNFSGIILIMDEHLVELSDDCSLRPVNGTTLRDRLYTHPATSALIDAPNGLHLFSASASECNDSRVILHLGKTGSVARDAPRILKAALDHRISIKNTPQ